jgi:hypothetical protein
MAAATQFTVTLEQSFTVYVNVYKPAGISFPPGGATLFAWLYKPTLPNPTDYNEGGWTANALTLNWDNEEHQENFSLSIDVADNAPVGETLLLMARLRLDNNSIWGNSGVTMTVQAVEVNGENIPINTHGNPSWNAKSTLYTADALISDVLIAPPASLSTFVIIGAAILAVLIIAIIVKKKIRISITVKKKM